MINPNARDDYRRDVALFRIAVLGDLIHRDLRRGELKEALAEKSQAYWQAPGGRSIRVAAKTIESWLTLHRRGGFEMLMPRERSDRNRSRSIPDELQVLILDMKRERLGRSAAQIIQTLVDLGRTKLSDFSVSSVQRLIAAHGLSGPRMELDVAARHRYRASAVNEIWQVDAVHGPKLYDPVSGRATTVKIFGLIDDRSRLVTYLRGSHRERQVDFLRTLFEAIRRRGIPRAIQLDNHGSFSGTDTRMVCAQLGIRLHFAKPYDGASKGKIERFWRSLRAQVLSELDLDVVKTTDDLNLRIMSWVDGRYNVSPHSGIDARTPLSVYEEEAEGLRFPADYEWLAARFVVHVDRKVLNDSTCSLGGRTFEVPQHLRRKTARLYYAVMEPDSVWVMDRDTQIPVREVDEVANSKRARIRTKPKGEGFQVNPPVTGVNGVEAFLRRKLGEGAAGGDAKRDGDEQGGVPCVQ
jgi:transposase InsO family protein